MSRLKEAMLGDTYYESIYPHRPGYRNTDTSREAAQSVVGEAARLQRLVLDALAIRPMTTDEAARHTGVSILGLRPRFSELRQLGRIVPTSERRKNDSGRNAIVWKLA